MTDQNIDQNAQPQDQAQDQSAQADQAQQNADQSKTVGGIKFYKEQLEKERQERERLAKEVEEIRTAKLKEQNNWKDLYEQEQKKASEYQEKLKKVSTSLVEDKMRTVIEREASKAGILPSALEDLDLIDKSIIEVETTSNGRINFHNVKEFVDSLKMKKPHWFGAHQDPNINNKRADYGAPKDLSTEEILDLQSKDPKKYNEIMRQKLGLK